MLAVANSPASTPSPVSGTLTVGKLAELVAMDRKPPSPPGCRGAMVTGTCSVSPAARVTGNVTGVVTPPCVLVTFPVLNGSGVLALDAVTPVTVTAAVAWAVTVALPAVPPTGTWPKLTGEAVSGALLGLPKPTTVPSLVPT